MIVVPLLESLKAEAKREGQLTNSPAVIVNQVTTMMDTLRLKFEVTEKLIPGIADKVLEKITNKISDCSKYGMSENIVEYSVRKMPVYMEALSSNVSTAGSGSSGNNNNGTNHNHSIGQLNGGPYEGCDSRSHYSHNSHTSHGSGGSGSGLRAAYR